MLRPACVGSNRGARRFLVVGLKRPNSGGILPVEPANKEFSSRDKLQGDGNIDFLIAIRADDLPVINDSEAFQYVGKTVRGARLGRRCHRLADSGPHVSISDENTLIRRSPGSLLAPKKA